jgi:hypothetical protein
MPRGTHKDGSKNEGNKTGRGRRTTREETALRAENTGNPTITASVVSGRASLAQTIARSFFKK